MCNLRLHDLARELPALQGTGLQVIAFFHSETEKVQALAGSRGYPIQLVGDPGMIVYRSYGVETSWPRLLMSMARPAFYMDWMRAMRHGIWGGISLRMSGMPAGFLIGGDGRILHAHYGTDIGDHMPVQLIWSTLAGDGSV